MGELELSEKFLAEIAGWDVMKQARGLLANDRVLSGNWSPPVLKGVVQTEGGSLRSGLVIKSKVDIENMCPCRQSREWGTMCAHSVGVGLRVLQREVQKDLGPKNAASPKKSSPSDSVVPLSRRRSAIETETATNDDEATLTLWVVFPPNWRQMLEQGKVTLFFEGETSGGRRPLNSIPTGTKYLVRSEDAKLLEQIELLAGGELPAMWPFDLTSLAEILSGLEEHPRLSVGRKSSIEVKREPWVPAMSAILEDDGRLRLKVTGSVADAVWIPGRKLYVAVGDCFQPMGLPPSCAAALQGEMLLDRYRIPEFLQSCGAFLAGEARCETNFTLDQFEFVPSAPKFSLSLVGGLAQLKARIECLYGARIFSLGITGKDEAVWVPDPDSKFRFTTRDPSAESTALNRVLRYGFRGPDHGGWYELRGQDAVLDFFAREYPKLEREWDVSMEERLQRSTEKNLERVQPRFEVRSSGIEWLDFRVDYASDAGTQFSESEIQQWLLSGRTHRKLSNGKVAMLLRQIGPYAGK